MVENFTEEDLIKFKKSNSNVFKLMFVLFFVAALAISLLSGIFGIIDFGYWKTSLFTFLFLSGVYLTYFSFIFILYYKDLRHQKKFTKTVTVISKTSKSEKKIIWTDSTELRRINLFDKEAFDLIQPGDTLYVEQTLASKFVLKIERNGIILLNPGYISSSSL